MSSTDLATHQASAEPEKSLEMGVFARALVRLIRVYQRALSPLLGNVCRFYPSCSRYAVACIEHHGAWRGSLLSVLRLCKCHPFHPGGVDLPPPPRATAHLPANPAADS